MPNTTEISVSYSRKVQLEQFEPVEHSVEIESEVLDDEDEDDVYDLLAERAEDMVERAIARRVTQQKMDEDNEDGD